MIASRIVEQEKGVSLSRLVEVIEEALLKTYHSIPGAVSKAHIKTNQKTSCVTAMAMNEDKDGNEISEFDDTPKNFGRIAQSTARSVTMQRLRDADDQKVLGGFTNRKGQAVTGIVDQFRDGRVAIIKVGDNFEVVLPDPEKTPGEAYCHGDRIRAFVINIERTEKGARITLPHTHPDLAAELFEREVPEIQQGLMKIKAIAREAGHRTKTAIATTCEGVNAKGVCIGPMGSRVCAVMTELSDEKIDVVDQSADPGRFVASALSPVRTPHVVTYSVDNRAATAIIPDFQLSLAIGKGRQDARLAARLTDFHVDTHSDTKVGGEGVASHSSMPDNVTSRSYSDPQDQEGLD